MFIVSIHYLVSILLNFCSAFYLSRMLTCCTFQPTFICESMYFWKSAQLVLNSAWRWLCLWWSAQIELIPHSVLPISFIFYIKVFQLHWIHWCTNNCPKRPRQRTSIACHTHSKSGWQNLPLFISAANIYRVSIVLCFGALYSLFSWHVYVHVLRNVAIATSVQLIHLLCRIARVRAPHSFAINTACQLSATTQVAANIWAFSCHFN